MNLVKVKCAFCGKEFSRRKEQFKEAEKFSWKQYCSRKCLSKSRIKRKMLKCECCGKKLERKYSQISPHNYCSQSCAAIINNKKCLKGHAKIKPKLKTCVKCGKQFKKSTGNKKYCSIKCRREAEQHTPEEILEILRNTIQRLGRIPAKRELRKIDSACRKIFGSWNNAIVAAGFQPNRSDSQRMYKRVFTKALDKHMCDSVSELLIDNWLYKNNIPHERNVSYPDTNHKADWTINFKRKTIFVEYFGLAKDSPRYDRSIIKKKTLCYKYKIKLIEVYPWDLYPKMNLDTKLKVFLN